MIGDSSKPYIIDRVRRLAVMIAAAVMFSVLPAQVFAADAAEDESAEGLVNGPEKIYAEEALLGDYDSGTILFEQNADERMIPASTTKVMTALLVIEAIERGELDVDEKVMAKQSIIDGVVYDASRVMPYIVDGEELTVKEYLYCIMLDSDCVACDVLAERVSGSVEEFVRQMNVRAGQLGCTETCFMNSHGYPVEGHYTNARSLFLIMRQAMNYQLFRELISTIKLEIPPTEKTPEVRKLYNSNWMIWDPEKIKSMWTRYYYPESIGGKTGSSQKSGHCLVSCAQKDGVTLIAVITGAVNEVAEETEEWTNRCFSESKKLFEWGFDNYAKYTIVPSGSDAGSVQITDGEKAQVRLKTAGEASVVLPKDDSNVNDVRKHNVYDSEALSAPVSSGDVLGRMELYYNGELRGSVGLIAAEDVKRQIELPAAPEKEKNSKGRTLPILITATILVFLGTLLLYITNNRRIILAGPPSGRNVPQVNRGSAEFFSGSDRYVGGGQTGQPADRAEVRNRSDRPGAQRERAGTAGSQRRQAQSAYGGHTDRGRRTVGSGSANGGKDGRKR